ncbi:MAG: hypothetical protein CMJ81_17940 [Planctomycetaceae bacterium]|nr:hypothetical protein [Planctomycetaceae bacterium]MBP61351.1 hypothetical protein [Planctomycetaceae bacterium]
MRSLQSVQRRTGFETLEAKKLFAADFLGAASVDLTDVAIVAETSHDWDNPSTGQTCRRNTGLGGQEGEPITGESAPVASIAPDGCVDLIEGATINSPDTGVGAEIDMPMVADNLTILNTAEAGLTERWRPSATGVEDPFGNPENSLKSKTSEASTNFTDNGLDSCDLVDDIHGDPYFAVDALYHSNELELATNLGGQEGEPVNGYMTTDTGEPLHTAAHEAAHVIHQLGDQEGESLMNTGLADHLDDSTCWDWSIRRFESVMDPSDCPGIMDAGLTGPIGGTLDRTPTVIGSSDTTSIEINLGGQEGEDFNLDPGDAVSGVAAVHTSGVVDSLASSKTSEFLHGNTNNAISMANTAEGGLDEISGIVIRMRELAVQSANGDFQVTDQHYFAVR